METVTKHKTVLLQEIIDGLLAPQKAGNDKLLVIDCTFGGGGHSLEICKRYPGVKIIALDQDRSVFKKAEVKFKNLGCDITFVNANFRELNHLENFGAFALEDERTGNPRRLNFPNGSVDAIIFDLGLSSDQLESSGRGFSFMQDEPLLMTMKENPRPEDVTAKDVVNTWSEENIANIIYGYGEERFSRRIAKAIIEARENKKIETTFELVKIISEAVPAAYKRGRLHFATKTFQAIRIAVNDELGALREALDKGFKLLKVGGRIAVISFHSLEDRIVKKFYKEKVLMREARLINKKVILASRSEIKNNPRSRSAKLRILEKIV